MKFSIPWAPPSNNVALRSHWIKRARLNRTAAAYIVQAIGKPRQVASGRVSVTIQMHRKRSMDHDNLWGASKCIFDSIVKLGWAVDDSPKWMEQQVLPVDVTRSEPWTDISIESS